MPGQGPIAGPLCRSRSRFKAHTPLHCNQVKFALRPAQALKIWSLQCWSQKNHKPECMWRRYIISFSNNNSNSYYNLVQLNHFFEHFPKLILLLLYHQSNNIFPLDRSHSEYRRDNENGGDKSCGRRHVVPDWARLPLLTQRDTKHDLISVEKSGLRSVGSIRKSWIQPCSKREL